MKRISIYLEEEQLRKLEGLAGNMSEHIRRSINEYLYKVIPKPTTSPSTTKRSKHV